MFLFTIAFLASDMYLQTLSHLPSQLVVCAGVISSLFAYAYLYKHWRHANIFAGLAIGLAWSFWHAAALLSWSLPAEIEGKTITVTGHIASLPVIDPQQTNCLFKLDKSLVKLSWHNNRNSIRVGDKWQLQVRLKRIHSTQNPGSFDYEAWALQKGIRATGYVMPNGENTLLSHAIFRYPIDQFRQRLQDKIRQYAPHSETSPWLMALIIGERNGIDPKNWQVLRNTGTNHLMAIAGLHIGIIAGFISIVVTWLWRRVPRLLLYMPAHLAGACASLFIAIFYSALAGFSLPTQRACIMLLVFILALLARKKINAWHAWSFAMLLVLILNPLSVLTESFWLSFGTIALIIYGMRGRLSPGGFWWKWGRVQWVIGFGLMPLTLLLFEQCSLVSFIANSIAIPWLGFFILPFCLLSSVFLFISPPIGSFILAIADKSLAILWIILTWFSGLHLAAWQQALPDKGLFTLTVVGFLLLLLPAGFPGRWFGILWLLPILLFKSVTPAMGQYWMTLLDVGQGLSVVIQTHTHTLVFDTGPKLSLSYDMGESVVLPYLRTVGVNKIDMLVVSHGDNDHIGGAEAILHNMPVGSIRTSVPEMLASPVTNNCYAGLSWKWDKVQFHFLHPKLDEMEVGNDSSCVLRIDNGVNATLLTGDIEKRAEKDLLLRDANQLNAEVLVAPHHGSKTSGLKEFVSTVHPHFVLYAIGYRNRYHFPHASVVRAYEKMGSMQLNTVDAGAIMFKFEGGKKMPELYRQVHKHYWFDS